MKKLILDLSKLNLVAKQTTHQHIQNLLFAMGFCWHLRNPEHRTKVRYAGTNALILNGNDPDHPNPHRKWNHIYFDDSFGDHKHDREYQHNGAEIFDAQKPNEIFAFLAAASDLVQFKSTHIETSTIGGVNVEIGMFGAILDFTDLLNQVQNEARRKWEAEFQVG